MKIAFWIVLVLLLVSWGVAGFFLFTQYEGRNAVGSYMKDMDKFTCTPVTQEDITGFASKAMDDASIDASIDNIPTTTESLCITRSELITAVYQSMAQGGGSDSSDDFSDSSDETDGTQGIGDGSPTLVATSTETGSDTDEDSDLQASADLENLVAVMQLVDVQNARVLSCMGEGKFVNEPLVGAEICEGDSDNLWPDLTEFSAQWGGCDMEIDKANSTFSYCANTDVTLVQCTQDGCNDVQ